MSTAGCKHLFMFLTALALLSCRREERRFKEIPPVSGRVNTVQMSELQPGPKTQATSVANLYEENASAVSEGKRLFSWYNCVGCHAHGGGGMGPPLMDDEWIYGSDPKNIFATIVEGRPNGMPSFRGKIPDDQVWKLVAYVRSMSGLLRKDVAPSRDDDMYSTSSEQQNSDRPETPRNATTPKSSEQSK